MNKRDEKFIARIKRKLGGDLSCCSQYMSFTISEYDHKHVASNDRVYRGQCSECFSYIKLKGKSYDTYQRLVGSKLTIIKSTLFTELFDLGDKR
jgi:hypothetical protein